MMKIALLLTLGLSTLPAANAGYQCTLAGASDEQSCFKDKDDDGSTCVWCSVSTFGFCVSESQAEAMEQNLPVVNCDRKSSDDDDAADDDATKADDDTSPNDDAIPDDYWKCLKQKDPKACHDPKYDCTWCDTKGGYGVCMDGPSAESAKNSAWFNCEDSQNEKKSMLRPGHLRTKDPLDPACLTAFLQDPSKDGCLAAVDSDGNACKFCSVQGFDVCINSDQADIAEQFGGTCDSQAIAANDPFDTACMLAFLQDQSKDGCLAAVDSDGNACEFCSYQGFDVCINGDQAGIAEQVGATCDSQTIAANDPFDTACMLAFLQDQSKDGCLAAVDSDGNACEFCSIQGADACINGDQATIAEQFGATCDSRALPTAVSME